MCRASGRQHAKCVLVTLMHAVQKLCSGAERAGYNGLMVTVDAPQLGKREADERNK